MTSSGYQVRTQNISPKPYPYLTRMVLYSQSRRTFQRVNGSPPTKLQCHLWARTPDTMVEDINFGCLNTEQLNNIPITYLSIVHI